MTSTLIRLAAAGALAMGTAGSVAKPFRSETAVLAGGCYWGMESVFEHTKGVTNVVSGYAGGAPRSFAGPGAKRDGFAEAVKITYDPQQISFAQLLQIFVDVAHDPTEVDRQGPDIGPRYRSAIFPQSREQKAEAAAFLARTKASGKFARPLATRIESGPFEVAETAQQDYVRKHPRAPYVVRYDLPKLADFKARYGKFWRDK